MATGDIWEREVMLEEELARVWVQIMALSLAGCDLSKITQCL